MHQNAGIFAPVDLVSESCRDGCRILRSRVDLGDYPEALTAYLQQWRQAAPERLFLAERNAAADWRRVSYGDAARYMEVLAAALLDRGLGPDRPLVILSGNSINHALLTLAALHVGVPVVPVSPAYSLASRDFSKLRHIVALVRPGLYYVETAAPFADALAAVGVAASQFVSGDGGIGASISDLLSVVSQDGSVEDAHGKVTADSTAKILFTSGSTGQPKGVINTHGMLCSNQQSLARSWPFIERRPPVLVDWLPWSHTFGGNHNFNLTLRNGGALYIDGGKPVPGQIGATVKNLKEISPTVYFNVPAGFDALLPFLEADEHLAQNFFHDLDLIFYAAAALPQKTWDRLRLLSQKTLGRMVPMTSGWGATETGPLATSTYFSVDDSAVIGVPVPGVEIKLAPVQERLEIRVRGPNVTPGYYANAEATAAAFDEDGFYRTGDAVVLCDPGAPERGLKFGGRISENFKLTSGTWVNVGSVRTAFVDAMSPLLLDVVVAGENRSALGALAFPNMAACRAVVGEEAGNLADEDILRHQALRTILQEKGQAYNRRYPGNSTRIAHLLFLTTPPDIDAGETTDKGYLNQRALLRRRADKVEELYRAGPDVIALSL